MADSVFNYMDPAGRARTAKSSGAVPGQVGWESAPLVTDPLTGQTRTPQGDAFNAFRGYVGPQGGGFGSVDKSGLDYSDPNLRTNTGELYSDHLKRTQAAIAANERQNIESEAAAQTKYGDGKSSPEYAATLRANAEQARLQQIEDARTDTPGGVDYVPPGGPVDSDPFGRFDAPTAANRVITPASEARLRTQREAAMALPNVAPPDPFASFQPPRPAVPGAPSAELFGGQPMNTVAGDLPAPSPVPTFHRSPELTGGARVAGPPPPNDTSPWNTGATLGPAPGASVAGGPFAAPVPFGAGPNVSGGVGGGFRRVESMGGRARQPFNPLRRIRPRPEDQVAGPASSLAAY